MTQAKSRKRAKSSSGPLPLPHHESQFPTPRLPSCCKAAVALGAYQGGVYEELSTAGYDPTWYAGISIGAVNAAILAGNPAESRLDRLREFWELITSSIDWPWIGDDDLARQTYNRLSAATAATAGLPGFFTPRFEMPFWPLPGTQASTSFYDTTLLRATLERLVDFDRINSGMVRLSLGAVNVELGNYIFFDTSRCRIGPEHVMASAALPPGFPAIEVNGHRYWDGGLVSNTPLFHVLEKSLDRGLADLRGRSLQPHRPVSRDILEVEERRKDIMYSSRTRENTTSYLEKHQLRKAILKLFDELPSDRKKDPELQKLRALGDNRLISLIHLIYRSKNFETHEKDYEFSRRSMIDHWASGCHDMRRTLETPKWLEPPHEGISLRVFDMTRAEDAVDTSESRVKGRTSA